MVVLTEPALPLPTQSEPAFDNELDEDTIAEGDEHRIQISGAPQASMMSFSQTMCVAYLKERDH